MCSSLENKLKSQQLSEEMATKLDEINKKIEALQKTVKEKERWKEIETERIDPRAENVTERVEIIKTSALVGAEAEHEQLEHLYRQKAKIFSAFS